MQIYLNRWAEQEPVMVRVINELAWCAHRGKEALVAGDMSALAAEINRNFDLRTELFGEDAPRRKSHHGSIGQRVGFLCQAARLRWRNYWNRS